MLDLLILNDWKNVEWMLSVIVKMLKLQWLFVLLVNVLKSCMVHATRRMEQFCASGVKRANSDWFSPISWCCSSSDDTVYFTHDYRWINFFGNMNDMRQESSTKRDEDPCEKSWMWMVIKNRLFLTVSVK